MAPGRAEACSHDDTAFFETFVDASCLQPPLTNTTLDALGGLRLATNGAATTTSWDTDTDFDNGVNFQSLLFAPVGVSTLQRTGTGAAATLGLPPTLLPLTPDGTNPVVRPATSSVLDGDGVDDPALARVGATYYMWYSGTAEDGGGPALFLATSTNGTTWVRANGGVPVLQGTAGAFDEDGVYGGDVVYDPADVTAPFKLWYSGRSDVFGGIGFATSTNGVTWVKYGGSVPVPVVNHGPAGSADSFGAADPSVLKDGSTWKMWYTGDDSSKKRIAYATSANGITWAKGGKVIAPEDPGTSANIAFGAFAPTVWKTASGYSMVLTGRKIVGGGVFQTKLMSSTSSDGITWSGPSVALNPSGSSTNFDFSNLNSPDLLLDPGSPAPYKLYYSGNTIDAHGNFHTRVGVATSTNGSSFSKVSGALTGNSVLDVGTAGTAFDARQAAGVSVAAPGGTGPKLVGFYWGTRGSDFKPRLGEATSADGSSWAKVAVSGDGGAVLVLPSVGNPFDKGGHRDPSVLYDSATYDLYFTALDSGGTRSIGFASTPEVAVTKQPNNGSWSATAQLLSGDGSGFDADEVAHPSVIKDGANYVMYYTGVDSGSTARIGRATSASAASGFTTGATAVLDVGSAGAFDSAGVKDPVVVKVASGDAYRMLYTGVDADGIERVGYATSTDGINWTKRGVVLNPSETAFDEAEVGVEPTGMLVDGSTLHVWANGVDRTGRTRGEHATTAFPTPVSPQPGVPSAWATYQLGSASTAVRDFRQVTRVSSGSAVALRMSFLQPYSSGGNEYWSDYFPVTVASTSEALNFLLTVHGVRWRAQLSTPASAPTLDALRVTHAPVSFATSGTAVSGPIAAATGRAVTAWGSLTVNTSLFSPAGSGSGTATARVLDAATGQQLASSALSTGGDTTVSLASIPAAAHPSIRLAFDLHSDGQATPRVNSVKVLYTTQTAPLVLTLAASSPSVVFGSSVTLTGTLAQGAATLAGAAVGLWAQPLGATTFTQVATLTTGAGGTFSVTAKPTKRTAYKVSYAGVNPEPTVTVAVAHKLTLSAVRKGTKATVRGRLAPAHPRRVVLIQVSTGSSWRTFAKVKTTKRSTFSAARKVKARGKLKFRAKTVGDKDHLAGLSPVFYLNRMKVSLAVKLSGRKATFSGLVTPRHPGRNVLVQVLRGTKWVVLVKAKLTKRSTFHVAKSLSPGTYDLRAVTLSDKDHWGGESRKRHLVVS